MRCSATSLTYSILNITVLVFSTNVEIGFVAEDIRRFNALTQRRSFELLMVLVQFSNSTGYYNHDDDLGDLEREL
jgi:hypothetical protein